jgi:hypothetical protein
LKKALYIQSYTVPDAECNIYISSPISEKGHLTNKLCFVPARRWEEGRRQHEGRSKKNDEEREDSKREKQREERKKIKRAKIGRGQMLKMKTGEE